MKYSFILVFSILVFSVFIYFDYILPPPLPTHFNLSKNTDLIVKCHIYSGLVTGLLFPILMVISLLVYILLEISSSVRFIPFSVPINLLCRHPSTIYETHMFIPIFFLLCLINGTFSYGC